MPPPLLETMPVCGIRAFSIDEEFSELQLAAPSSRRGRLKGENQARAIMQKERSCERFTAWIPALTLEKHIELVGKKPPTEARQRQITSPATTVFYSWQSDLPNSTNRGFIGDCLERAIKELKADPSLTVDPCLDRDTQNVPGSPDIASTIFDKIDKCGLFVCDVSIVNHNSSERPMPNPNVLIELGYAVKTLGWSRIVCIFNTAFGKIQDSLDIRPAKGTELQPSTRERQNGATEAAHLPPGS